MPYSKPTILRRLKNTYNKVLLCANDRTPLRGVFVVLKKFFVILQKIHYNK